MSELMEWKRPTGRGIPNGKIGTRSETQPRSPLSLPCDIESIQPQSAPESDAIARRISRVCLDHYAGTLGSRINLSLLDYREGQVPKAVSRWQPLLFKVVPSTSNRIMSFATVEIRHL
jgi:hypothetical protein